ncbi:MAG: DUF4395 domain-containing protein [Calditrichia bacterium]
MKPPSPTTRRRLEIQGFEGIDDNTLGEVAGWLRFSTIICTVLMGLGTALASPLILWAIIPFALLGAIFTTHPFDLIYNYGIHHLTHTKKLPPNGPPRRFACALASLWLAATGFAFYSGAMTVGYILGICLTSVALLVSTTDFCIPSHIFRFLFRKPLNTESENA